MSRNLSFSIFILLFGILVFPGCEHPVVCDGSLSASLLINPTDCGSQTGKISVSASGGISPYTFSINQSNDNSSGIFEGLEVGEHQIEVTDSEGCKTEVEGEVLTGLTYKNDIKPIITENCAISGCHVIGSSTENFTITSVVLERIDNIKEMTQSLTMPPDTSGRSLTQEEIDLIGCWVDDGGPE